MSATTIPEQSRVHALTLRLTFLPP
jgi:hypothetical protein